MMKTKIFLIIKAVLNICYSYDKFKMMTHAYKVSFNVSKYRLALEKNSIIVKYLGCILSSDSNDSLDIDRFKNVFNRQFGFTYRKFLEVYRSYASRSASAGILTSASVSASAIFHADVMRISQIIKE